jgi:hypothetical protein
VEAARVAAVAATRTRVIGRRTDAAVGLGGSPE